MGRNTIAIYEPRRLKEKDFLDGFVARVELVDFLLEQLRLCADGDGRHRLILGQRGMGKTSLLRRIQLGIRDDPALSAKLLPLTFREEQYNVRSLDQFWRNCGDALAEWLETTGDAAAADALDRAMQTGAGKRKDGAGDAFAATMAGFGRRAVLLVDNLDLILNALPEPQHWQLRRILQAPGGPILYGAATQLPQQTGDPDAAFYEFFRWDVLDPLSEQEMMACIRRLAAINKDTSAPVMAVLERAPERLRALHTLTGGNPRVLSLLYQLLERADSDTVYSDLEELLDQVTPLYKARVEELRSDLQRAVFDAIALHWDPITTHDLSAITGIEVTGLSPQLGRLREFGLIEDVSTSGARPGYQLGERFFNVWYLMRHGTRRTRQRLRWLTAFLQTFYSTDELLRLRDRTASGSNGSALASQYAEALESAIERATGRSARAMTDQDEHVADDTPEERQRAQARAAFDRAFEAREANRFDEAIDAYRTAIGLDPKFTYAWINLGLLLTDRLENPTEAETCLRKALDLDPDDSWANFALIGLLAAAGRREEAQKLRNTLPPDRDSIGLSLLDATIAAAEDNFGLATDHLEAALSGDLGSPEGFNFSALYRALRLFKDRGYGERLIGWFDVSGLGDRQAPIRAAFVAHVRGASALLDVNPEVRAPAERILYFLSGPSSSTEEKPKPRRRSGIRRRRTV